MDRYDDSWARSAACRDHPHPDLWFPTTVSGEAGYADSRPAIKICTGCPVRFECLDHALEHGEQHGIWGGMSEADRRRLRRNRRGDAEAAA